MLHPRPTRSRPRPARRERAPRARRGIDRLLHPPRPLVRGALAVTATAALSALLVVATTPPNVYAVDVFGELRAPGEPAFIVGHRGDRATAPENTMPALEAAMDGPMAFVETDVQLTADGVPVLFHDVELDRVTGRSGTIGALTAAEVAGLDAGAWYSEDYRGVGVPTLEEFLAALGERPGVRALVELKGEWTDDEVRLVTGLIELAGVRDRVVLQSFSLATLFAAQRVAPFTPRIMLVRELPADPVPLAERFGVIAFGTTAKSVAREPAAVERLHEAGLGILCYTLNSESKWEEVRALGVDGIITDEPSDLDAWIAQTAPGT